MPLKGECLFSLDADDRLRSGWINRGIGILDSDPQVGVNYGDAQCFGRRTGPFDADRLLYWNFILASALCRRSGWEQNSGYDGRSHEMRKYLFIMAQEGRPWGGSEPLWSSAAEKLVRQGNEVRVSVRDWGKPVPQIENLRLAGCQIFYRDEYRLPSFVTRQIRRIFPPREYSLEHVRKIGRGVDLMVISQGANFDGLRWMERARSAGLKYVAIAQSAVVYWWPVDQDAERLAESYENASATYFVSQANLDLSRFQFGSPLRNAKVVRNPFNVRYDARPPWPADSADRLTLACVGRLDVISKAQDVLLQVLGLPHWRERKVRLSLVGTGPNQRGLRRMVERLGMTNVEFVGQHSDIEEIWAKHHALVLP